MIPEANHEYAAYFESVNEEEAEIDKLVDSKILFEMFRIFDFNARFFVCSFYSNIGPVAMGSSDGHNNHIQAFKEFTSRMNIALSVSVVYSEEYVGKWNLRGFIVFYKKYIN